MIISILKSLIILCKINLHWITRVRQAEVAQGGKRASPRGSLLQGNSHEWLHLPRFDT